MPLALEPNETFKVVLEHDTKKAKEKQPFFEFRYLSGREWKKIAKQADKMEDSIDGAAAIDKVFDIIRSGLVGWDNMFGPDGKKISYQPKELDRIVTLTEAQELLFKFRNQIPEAADLKN